MSEAHDRPVSPDGECGDAAVYLLGLLDAEWAEAFLEHARGCAVCADELAALAPAVDILPATVRQRPAPAHVKERVMAVARSEAALRGAAIQRGEAVGEGEAAGRGAAAGRGETVQRGEVARAARSWRPAWAGQHPRGHDLRLGGPGGSPRQLRRRQAPRRRQALALLASAAFLVGGVAIGALSSPFAGDSPQVRVVSAEVTLAGASASLHESGGHAWLTVAGMPEPPAGHVYEVWVKRPGGPPRPTSSLFTPTASGTATVAVPGTLTGAGEVMVTQEPGGGSQAPTSPAVIVAHLV